MPVLAAAGFGFVVIVAHDDPHRPAPRGRRAGDEVVGVPPFPTDEDVEVVAVFEFVIPARIELPAQPVRQRLHRLVVFLLGAIARVDSARDQRDDCDQAYRSEENLRLGYQRHGLIEPARLRRYCAAA